MYRFAYGSYGPYGGDIAKRRAAYLKKYPSAPINSLPESITAGDSAQDDAFDTLLQWLYYRLDDTR